MSNCQKTCQTPLYTYMQYWAAFVSGIYLCGENSAQELLKGDSPTRFSASLFFIIQTFLATKTNGLKYFFSLVKIWPIY